MRYVSLSLWSLLLFAGAARGVNAQAHDPARHAASTTPLYQDLGTYSHKITTKSPTAQQYFDQGLRLTYAFNHEEALNSFHTAITHDSTCAMCWWGIANALGPNINASMDSAAVKPAYEAITRASELAAHATPGERAIIAATAKRYSAEPPANRAPLDSAYAGAMRDVVRKFPRDPDAQTLYAEALMD